MENPTTRSRIRRTLPAIALLALIAALMVISFLPSIRGAAKPAAASNTGIDGEAMRILACARAHAASDDFSTTLNGSIKARVFGIPYTQSVSGGRTVNGSDFTDVAESVSTFVKAGVKKECKNGEYFVSDGKYKRKRFAYSYSKPITKQEYIERCGAPSVGLVRYELDNTVIGAERVSENTYRYILEPQRAATYYRNQVKSVLDDSKYPEFDSIEFTMTVDGERAVKITSKESFRIQKFGGASCSSVYTETFCYG